MLGVLMSLFAVALATRFLIESFYRWCYWYERPTLWALLAMSMLNLFVSIIIWSAEVIRL